MLGIADYAWRLLPGNPIFRRVVESAAKKRRDLLIRCGYLGLLIALVIWTWANASNDTAYTNGDLSALAKQSAILFLNMSYLQLGLVALLSPIFTAGAITQEKDSQTYDILLSTPLTNGQIVLGSLMSRVFFIVALLVSGIPIFAVTQIFGGVAISRIVYSFLIAATTALVTGAMAMAIATFKIGTRRTIFSFYLFIVTYLAGVYLLDQLDFFHLAWTDASNQPHLSQTSWLTGIHPFLALSVLFDTKTYVPPAVGDLPAKYNFWPVNWYLSNPISFYPSFMCFLSMAMILPSIVLLRRVAQSSTTLRTVILQKLHLSSGDKTRKPRTVWRNPIAWREGKTKASAARSMFLRYGFITAGLGGAIVLLIMYRTDGSPPQYILPGAYDTTHNILHIEGEKPTNPPIDPSSIKIHKETGKDELGRPKLIDQNIDALLGKYEVVSFQQAGGGGSSRITSIVLRDFPRKLQPDEARSWLLGITAVEFAVILLIVSNAAASTVTREKEDGTLDLLLTTPITSRYYIWGKLRGLVSFVEPLVAVPVVSAGLFIAADTLRWALGDSDFQWIVFPEALLLMPAMLLIVCAFAAILGMHMSLRCRTTVRAVMSSVGIIVGACFLLGWCGYGLLESSRSLDSQVSLAIANFSPFTLIAVLIDPYHFGGRSYEPGVNNDPADITDARIIVFVVAVVAVAVYAFGVWSMYKSMVKNFDMTIRRQSR